MTNDPLQENLLAWFAGHGRDLPWRRTYDPYHILVSEMMLQQTQMERVLAYFRRWLERFPDLASLAEAEEEEVLKLWEGLGYYSRARNLLKAARLIRAEGGRLPDDYGRLIRLPGIGPYTAGAVLSLAFNRDVPVVDGNVERVFARLFDLDAPVKTRESQTFIRQQARELLPAGRARWFNQALMELGALVCLPRNPRCPQCPLHDRCESRRLGITDERPVPGKGRSILPIQVVTGILGHQGLIYIQKRPPTGVWANLWEFPGGRIEPGETPEEALVREYLEETGLRIRISGKITVIKHGYTRYQVTLHCFSCRLEGSESPREPVLHAAQAWRWAPPEELEQLAFPAAHRKLIDLLVRNALAETGLQEARE